jgi:hypothetical protein
MGRGIAGAHEALHQTEGGHDMTPFFAALGLVAAVGVGAAAAQVTGAQNDCAFLEQSFQEVYDGMREMADGQASAHQGHPDPAVVTMFVGIQTNIILLHEARGCDASKLVELARKEKQQYGD